MEGWLLYVTLCLAAVGAITLITASILAVTIWRDRYLMKKQSSGSCFAKLRIIQ